VHGVLDVLQVVLEWLFAQLAVGGGGFGSHKGVTLLIDALVAGFFKTGLMHESLEKCLVFRLGCWLKWGGWYLSEFGQEGLHFNIMVEGEWWEQLSCICWGGTFGQFIWMLGVCVGNCTEVEFDSQFWSGCGC
jgi:hypothetical protein